MQWPFQNRAFTCPPFRNGYPAAVPLAGKFLIALAVLLVVEGCSDQNQKNKISVEKTLPTETHSHTNRLAREKSPYLQQHQHNPVDWFAWGDEAFAKARAEH
ncbi:MAG: DUF255 domain-containing protein, partial [Verrucomicrobiota bacterium]